MTKPAEILKLEEFYNITLTEDHYKLDKNNQIIILDLKENLISDIKILKELKSLIFLDLSYNQINNIRDVKELISSLTNLNHLSIFNNPFLESLELNLKLDIKSNNLIDLKNYFAKEEESNKVEFILPAKIMIFGNHSSGKSSFLGDFINIPRESKSSTHVLDIRHYRKTHKDAILPDAIFFDFGGQDYYHGVYKAFMTNDCTNLVFWQQSTDNNKISKDKSNRNSYTQNFDRNYWIKQLKHYEKREDENKIWLIQTHLDEEGHNKAWINSEDMSKNVANEFHTSFKNDKFKASWDDLKKSLDEEIKEKQIKVKQPVWYKEFLEYILSSKSNDFTTLEEIKKSYHRENIIEEYFKNDLEQLSRQGLILYYPHIKELENVAWLNPCEAIKRIHTEVLSEENIKKYNGIVPKNDFENFCDEKLRFMLLENRVIFFDENDENYIIPSYLSRIEEEGNDFKANFTLKFSDFIPFGFINQLICAYCQTKEIKKYWRDMLMFTSDDKKIKISIKLDFEELKIEVFIDSNNEVSKQRINQIERFIFEDILAFYYDVTNYKTLLINKEYQINYQRKFPDDMYLSVNSDYFVKYSTLMNEKSSLNNNSREFDNFTNIKI